MAVINAFQGAEACAAVVGGGFPSVISWTQNIIGVPFADQLSPPPPTPDAGAFVWQRSIVDSAGNVLTDARVEVRHAETNAIAPIYSDRAATLRKSNPFIVDGEGFAQFYALAGLYNITASRAGLERIYENVLLGIRVDDMPDLTTIVAPIVEDALAVELGDLDTALAALPDLVNFRVDAAGNGVGLPDGYSSTRLSLGYYRVAVPFGHNNYKPKLTVWDPSSDRLYGAMMYSKTSNAFEYRVRSIHDEASNSDAIVDIELTLT